MAIQIPHTSAPPALQIRRMALGDLPAVMILERLAFKHPWSPELFQRELMHDWSTILLAVPMPAASTGVFGFVIFWLVHDEIHVLNVATHPDHRRQGIGRRLMQEAIAQARTHGARLATLEVRRSNFGAITLYRELGFRPVGVRKNYYTDEGEDALVMSLDL